MWVRERVRVRVRARETWVECRVNFVKVRHQPTEEILHMIGLEPIDLEMYPEADATLHTGPCESLTQIATG